MTKVKGLLGFLTVCACVWSCLHMNAKASEDAMPKNSIMIAEENIEIKESADEAAGVLYRLEKGASVYVVQKVDDTWCMVSYQDISGYVKNEQLKGADIDLEALAGEMDTIEQEGEIVVEEVERVRTEQSRSHVWIIAVILVLWGIIMTGILCSRLQKRKKGKKRRKRR